MKKLLYILTLLPILALGQSQDQNYIKTTTYKKPTTEVTVDVANPADAVVQVTYFDGLGRPIQQVAHKQSNSGKDIVTHIEYDSFGRQTKDYLPFTYNNQNTNYVDPTTVTAELSSFYSTYNGGTIHPYSEKELEASPLNRVFKQAGPGDAWAKGSGKEIKFDYQSNTANDEVKLFKVTATWDGTLGLFTTSISSPQTYYNAGQLYKTITKNENWTSGVNNTTEEFKNKTGQVVLKRTYNNDDKHDTYYLYDIRGNLSYVLPPLAEGVVTQSVLDNLGYRCKYDHRNRLVEKKLPGKQWEFIIYDKLDRPVATGPAFSPYGGGDIGWMITEYDVFGRVTQTGWKKMSVTATSRTTNQNNVTAGNNPFIMSANDILTKNYYDDYTYPNAPTPLPTQIEGQDIATNVKGLPTGSWTKVLDVSNANAAETAYTLYDDRYRPVRTYTSNHLGGFTQVDSKLDWAGKTEYTVTTHKFESNTSLITVTDTFEYTDQDRLSLHKQQIGSGDEQLIAKNTYDELGQLISKKVGGQDATGTTGLQTVDYNYNIRGWLKNINDVNNIGNDLFAFKISYNDFQAIGTNDIQPEALFNGNISATYWKTKYGSLQKYNYSYDDLNRLNEAVYLKPELSINDINAYNETLSYDKNGNIQTLERNGGINAGLPNPIDELTYTYDTNNKNLLVKVADASTSPQGFKDGVNTTDDYQYDANRNMTIDNNKGIRKIIYNHLNLPTGINFAGTDKISYIYNAIGQKVAKVVSENSATTKIHYLAGGFQYKNNALQFFPHAEGYVKYEGSNYSYVFNYADHLGNIRLSYTDIDNNGTIDIDEIVEENEYYPFGLKHESHTSSNSYQLTYNGTELQTELNLNVYDLGARLYDPALARFMVMDPMADFVNYQSPFVASDNNPILYRDEYGLGILNVIGNLFRRAKNGVKRIFSGKNCNCGGREESIVDSWRRPDFGWYESDKGSGRSYSKSKKTNNNNNSERSSVVAINLPDYSPKPPTVNLSPFAIYNTSSSSSIVVDGKTLKDGDKTTVNKKISFEFGSDSMKKGSEANNEKILLDLIKTLKEYPQLKVLILGNAWGATGSETAATKSYLNGKSATFGDIMLARARAVERFFIDKGIDWKRLSVGTGTISNNNSTTSFIIKN